jgi:transcription initiation factor TFIIB
MSTILLPSVLHPHTQYTKQELQWFEAARETSNEHDSVRCRQCGSTPDDWEMEDQNICKLCGEVQECNLEIGAEYRFFNAEDRSSNDPSRVGAPTDTRFPSSNLGTIILLKTQGGNANNAKAMNRIRRYHTWNMIPYKERSLLQVFEQFSIASINNGINGKAIDTAKELYIQLVEHCDRRGMSRNCVVASSVYAALKIVGEPRKPKEIADMFHLTTAQFTKAYKYFQEVLAMAKQRGHISKVLAPANLASTKASNYITNPLSKLPLARSHYSEIQQMCMDVADKAESLLVSPENMPPSLAAGTIAFVLQRTGYTEITTERIASVCNVSEGTLQKCLKRLEAAKDSLWSSK